MASSRSRAARTCSCISARSPVAATAAWTKGRRSSSTLPRARRDPRQKTSESPADALTGASAPPETTWRFAGPRSAVQHDLEDYHDRQRRSATGLAADDQSWYPAEAGAARSRYPAPSSQRSDRFVAAHGAEVRTDRPGSAVLG